MKRAAGLIIGSIFVVGALAVWLGIALAPDHGSALIIENRPGDAYCSTVGWTQIDAEDLAGTPLEFQQDLESAIQQPVQRTERALEFYELFVDLDENGCVLYKGAHLAIDLMVE